MKKITLYIGLNDKDTKRQEISTLEAYKMARNAATLYTGGATIYEVEGVYRHDDEIIIREKSLKLELIDPNPDDVKALAATLKATLNQESILQTVETLEGAFI